MKFSEITNSVLHSTNDLCNLISCLDEDIQRATLYHLVYNCFHVANRTFCPKCAQRADSWLPNNPLLPRCGACGAELVELKATFWDRHYEVKCECGGFECGAEYGTYTLDNFFDSHSDWQNKDRFALLEVGETYIDSQSPGHKVIVKRIK